MQLILKPKSLTTFKISVNKYTTVVRRLWEGLSNTLLTTTSIYKAAAATPSTSQQPTTNSKLKAGGGR